MRFPLRLVPQHTNFDFIAKKHYAFIFSFLLTVLVIFGLVFKGVNFGIDFAGGILVEFSCSEQTSAEELREFLNQNHYNNFHIQEYHTDNNKNIMLRFPPLASGADNSDEIAKIKELLSVKLGKEFEFKRIDYVGPKVGYDFTIKSFIALAISLVVMMLYTWLRFEWQFGIGVILALLHDAIITLGFYLVTGYEFDFTSIAAILTVVGYSINDSVVIYDRIRENLVKFPKKEINYIINLSINETLSRTVMTVLTTLVVCLVLGVFGGDTLRGFSFASLFGIAFGTYSSIYISAPILTIIHHKNKKRRL